MDCSHLERVVDTSIGDWIAPELCGFGRRVCGVVPRGYDEYARIFHPAVLRSGELVSWATVCQATKRVHHPLMQWDRIAAPLSGQSYAGSSLRDAKPNAGSLEHGALSALLAILEAFDEPSNCHFHALWDGWGWLNPGSSSVVASGVESHRASEISLEHGARLQLPGRDYLVLKGPLWSAAAIGYVAADARFSQSPNMLWPSNRAWFVATEVDFDSTLIGGSSELIDAVVASTELEALSVKIEDDLTSRGDKINSGS